MRGGGEGEWSWRWHKAQCLLRPQGAIYKDQASQSEQPAPSAEASLTVASYRVALNVCGKPRSRRCVHIHNPAEEKTVNTIPSYFGRGFKAVCCAYFAHPDVYTYIQRHKKMAIPREELRNTRHSACWLGLSGQKFLFGNSERQTPIRH